MTGWLTETLVEPVEAVLLLIILEEALLPKVCTLPLIAGDSTVQLAWVKEPERVPSLQVLVSLWQVLP